MMQCCCERVTERAVFSAARTGIHQQYFCTGTEQMMLPLFKKPENRGACTHVQKPGIKTDLTHHHVGHIQSRSDYSSSDHYYY